MNRGRVPALLIVKIYVVVQIGVSFVILHAKQKLPFTYILLSPPTHTSTDSSILWSY